MGVGGERGDCQTEPLTTYTPVSRLISLALFQGHYQTELLTNRSVKIIAESVTCQPFFMYLSYGAPHSPVQVPQHYKDHYCSHVTNEERKHYCGMMAALDEGVGKVVEALKLKVRHALLCTAPQRNRFPKALFFF